MLQALAGRPAPEFQPPPGLVEVWIDGETGYRAGAECPHVMREAFLPRTEPREVCPVFHLAAWTDSLPADSTGLDLTPPPGLESEAGE
jgi:membrane carboxypeptidase/penicillin-binding protein